MKSNFKLNKIIFIISIMLSVPSINNVYAWNSVTGAPDTRGGYIYDEECEKNDRCFVLCGYEYVWNHLKYKNSKERHSLYAYSTIYYLYVPDGPDLWRINFTDIPGTVIWGDRSYFPDGYLTSGKFNHAGNIFNSSYVHVEIPGFDPVNKFKCPKYFYPDSTESLLDGGSEECFDEDGVSCSKLNNVTQRFTPGPNKWSTVKITKTRSLFSQIENYHRRTVALDMDCNILIDKESKYVNDDGTLNGEEVKKYFQKKIANDFLVNFLNKGNKNGPIKAVPRVIANHASYKEHLFSELEGKDFETLKSTISEKCIPEIEKKVEDGELSPEAVDQAQENIDNMTPDMVVADEDLMKHYLNYTVKGDPIPTDPDCTAILSADVTKLFLAALRYIQYLGPVLVVVLSTVDFIKAAASGSPDDMKKAWNKLVKRLIAAILLFFVALITRLLLSFFDITVPENCLK